MTASSESLFSVAFRNPCPASWNGRPRKGDYSPEGFEPAISTLERVATAAPRSAVASFRDVERAGQRPAMAFIVTPTAPRRNYRTPPGEGTRRKSLIQSASDSGTADAWQMFQGDDKHRGPLPLASPGPASEPGDL